MTYSVGFQHFVQFASGLIFGYPDPFEIKATPDNLRQAIQERGKEILECKFKDTFQTYCSRICSEKQASVVALLELGANVEKSTQHWGTQSHFYMDCLSEQTPPNLEILRALLDKTSDVNSEDTGSVLTSAVQ